MTRPLSVAIDARIVSGTFGGVEQFTIGLVHALSRLSDGEEEYAVLAYSDGADWIEPFAVGPCRVVRVEPAPPPSRLRPLARQQHLRALRRPWHALKALRGPAGIPLPRFDDGLEAMFDVVHFPMQNAVLTDLPSLYHPWDLQHRHLSALFTPYERLWREVRYTAFLRQAAIVVVASEWGRRDISTAYPEVSTSLLVVPVPPVTEAYPSPDESDLERSRRKHHLERTFALYPSKTWPHKNHLALLKALSALRRRGLRIPLVCSGGQTDDFSAIRDSVRKLGLDDQVNFVGYVSPLDLECLYRLARCLIYPSRFEGWGLPLMEAFRAGLPVACSRVTCLPEQVGDAAILFDPDDALAIAASLERLWVDEALRNELRRRGHERASLFSWERTAKLFRAEYRRVAGRPLNDEDRELLAM